MSGYVINNRGKNKIIKNEEFGSKREDITQKMTMPDNPVVKKRNLTRPITRELPVVEKANEYRFVLSLEDAEFISAHGDRNGLSYEESLRMIFEDGIRMVRELSKYAKKHKGL